MELDRLPVQVQALLRRLAQLVASREPAIRAGIQALREKHPHLTSDQLAMELIRSTRKRVAATGAISGAASIAPGLGTLLAVGTITSQTLFALEQEVELVHGGGRCITRILSRFATSGAAKVAARVIPLGVGVGVGAGFDWIAVTGLGRAAVKYYGPGGPGARPLLL